MVSLYGPSGRSRIPGLLAGGAALLAIGVAVGVTVGGSSDPAPAGTAGTTAGPSAPVDEPADPDEGLDEGAPPTGCLGGPERTAQAVLEAQAHAPRSSFGAVELAATYLRFFMQYPVPDAEQIAASDTVVASTATDEFRDLAGEYEASADEFGPPGLKGTETPFHLTTDGGRWLVEETSTADRVIVQVSEPYVVNGTTSEWLIYEAFVVVWEDDAWHIESAQQADTDALDAAGTTFTEGC